jgi:hypothetical protein
MAQNEYVKSVSELCEASSICLARGYLGGAVIARTNMLTVVLRRDIREAMYAWARCHEITITAFDQRH